MFILNQIELSMQWLNCGIYKLIICCHSEVWNFGNKFSDQIVRVKFYMVVIFLFNKNAHLQLYRKIVALQWASGLGLAPHGWASRKNVWEPPL